MSRKTKIAPNPRPPTLHCSRLISWPRRARSPRATAAAKTSPMTSSAEFIPGRSRPDPAAAGPGRRGPPCTPKSPAPIPRSRAGGTASRAPARAPGWRTGRRPACRSRGPPREDGRRGAGNPAVPGGERGGGSGGRRRPRSRGRPAAQELQGRGDEDPGAVIERPLVQVEPLVVMREDLAGRLVAGADEEEGARRPLLVGGEVLAAHGGRRFHQGFGS